MKATLGSPHETDYKARYYGSGQVLDPQSSLGKEGLNQMRFLSQAGNGKMELLVQLFEVTAHQVDS